MSRITAHIRGTDIVVDIPADPALGWRFWRTGGFPDDPVEPRRYGGTRCIQLAPVRHPGGDRWLYAMERDASLRLFTPHELFPCADQEGAEAFARSMLAAHGEPNPPLAGQGRGGGGSR